MALARTGLTARYGVPLRQNIYGRILIAVMMGTALGTVPLPHGQRQRLDDAATNVAALTRREPAVNRLDLSPIPRSLLPVEPVGPRLGKSGIGTSRSQDQCSSCEIRC
jgi:hypothetical protein